MIKEKIYQVIYCDFESKRIKWHLLECPLIGIRNLDDARWRARRLKDEYGERAQTIIIGEVLRQTFRTLDADYLYGITALRGADARQDPPSLIFEENREERGE